MTAFVPLIFGFAMFLGWNIVSIPIGIISGFQEARGKPLSRRSSATLEVVDTTAEMAVLIAISLKLIHASEGRTLEVIGLAYGTLIVLEYIALKALKKSTPKVWLRGLAVMLSAASVSILVG